MTDKELMQMALDALEHLQTDIDWQYRSPTRAMLRKVEKALRARLAQGEPEELGEIIPADEEQLKRIAKLVEPEPVAWTPQREWQGLTDEEIRTAASLGIYEKPLLANFIRAIETKLKEKNASR